MSSPSKRSWIQPLLTIGCVVALCLTVDVRESLVVLSSVDVRMSILVCLTALMSRSLRTYKWNILLRTQGIVISFWRAQLISWAGAFFAFWTPAGIGSDAYRFASLSRDGQQHAVASTLIVERYVGLLSVCLVWIGTLPVSLAVVWSESPSLTALLFVISGTCIGLAPLLASPRLPRQLAEWMPARATRVRQGLQLFADSLARYRNNSSRLFVFIALSLVEVISYVVINYLSARALGFEVPFLFLLCAMPPVYLLLRLPISIQGFGIQEGAMGLALSPLGLSPTTGVAISLLQRAVEVVCFVLPGAVCALSRSNGLLIDRRSSLGSNTLKQTPEH